jgi:hypothetical protein
MDNQTPFVFVPEIGQCIAIKLSDDEDELFQRGSGCVLQLSHDTFTRLVYDTINKWEQYALREDIAKFQSPEERVYITGGDGPGLVTLKFRMTSVDQHDIAQIVTKNNEQRVEILAAFLINMMITHLHYNGHQLYVSDTFGPVYLYNLRRKFSLAQSLTVS